MYDHLVGKEIANGYWSWDADRALLYAVGVGAGLDDPLRELQFTTENTTGVTQQVIPTFITLMGLKSDWMEMLGWKTEGLSPIGMVHGEQSVTLARAIPISGKVHLSTVLRGVYDKGSGALVVNETRITLADTDEYLGSACMKVFAQGKGGFGGPRRPDGESAWILPNRDPDHIISLPVGLNQSLIYRLSGDHHPHGTEPARARADGFERPIFYGLGSYGVACRALMRGVSGGEAGEFSHMEGRFSKPVHPGDRLDTRIWLTNEGALFQTWANGERLVIDRGIFIRRPAVKSQSIETAL